MAKIETIECENDTMLPTMITSFYTITLDPMVATVRELQYVRTVTFITMTVAMALVNLAMGAAIGKEELGRQWRVPGGVLVGCITQFLLFPLSAYGIAHIFSLPQPFCIGMVLVGICPGGSMANVVSFFVDGDICLSTSMILISTVISVGFVPMIVFILSRNWYPGSASVSLWIVGVAVIIIAIPLALGSVVRALKETLAKVVIVIGLVGGLLAFTSNALIHLIIHTQIFHAPLRVYFAVMLLPVIGYLIGLVVPIVFGQQPPSRHTLAITAVFQNTSVAIMILATTFPDSPSWHQLVVVPALYGPITALYGVVYIIIYLAVLVHHEDNDQHQGAHCLAEYLPIDETPRGNAEYMTLEGDDHDVDLELNDRGYRLEIKDV